MLSPYSESLNISQNAFGITCVRELYIEYMVWYEYIVDSKVVLSFEMLFILRGFEGRLHFRGI